MSGGAIAFDVSLTFLVLINFIILTSMVYLVILVFKLTKKVKSIEQILRNAKEHK